MLSGWNAIRAAGRAVYGDQEPLHSGTLVTAELGGPDPLRGVDCYRSSSFGAPQWHYVSYGLTELDAKESLQREVSGWGFELSIRVRRGAEQQPPSWPVGLFQNLARYTFATGRVLAADTLFSSAKGIPIGGDEGPRAAIRWHNRSWWNKVLDRRATAIGL